MHSNIDRVPTRESVKIKERNGAIRATKEAAKRLYDIFYKLAENIGVDFGSDCGFYLGDIVKSSLYTPQEVSQELKDLLNSDGWLNIKVECDLSCYSGNTFTTVYATRPSLQGEAATYVGCGGNFEVQT